MRRSYLLLALCVVVLLTTSAATATWLRSGVLTVVSKLFIKRPFNVNPELEQLRLENTLLRQRLDELEQAAVVEATAARVIYRGVSSWESTLWIDVSAEKGSPVVLGDAVVGVVDYVGRRHSRVRLLTDSGFHPSVRVQREGLLLAKGELAGGKPLRGTGFNYDFPDEAGPARDLRTGVPSSGGPPTPLVQPDDLLVTTGMDGVFPPGLKVARVKEVYPLREGGIYYDITAEPILTNFNDLTLLFVLPSQRFGHFDA